jgi:hypothetical protein
MHANTLKILAYVVLVCCVNIFLISQYDKILVECR